MLAVWHLICPPHSINTAYVIKKKPMKPSFFVVATLLLALFAAPSATVAAGRFDTAMLKKNLDDVIDHVRTVRNSKNFGSDPFRMERGLSLERKRLTERQTTMIRLAVEQFAREQKAWSERHGKGQFKLLDGVFQIRDDNQFTYPAIRFYYSSNPKEIFTACVCVSTDESTVRSDRVAIGPYATDITYAYFEFVNFGPMTSPSLSCTFLGDDAALTACAAPRGKLIRLSTHSDYGDVALAPPEVIRQVEELVGTR